MPTHAAHASKSAVQLKSGQDESLADRIRAWLLAGFAAVCVARPLVPSEGVAWLGDGHAFTILLLLLTGGYFVLAWQERRLTRKLHVTDWAVLALVAFCVISALAGIAKFFLGGEGLEFKQRQPAPRLALNMAWEWVGLGLTYFLTRQLPATALHTRVLVAIMVAVATAIAALGLYQVAVTLPAERAAYAADPDRTLEDLGQWFPSDSPERARFEARLASTEPLATFALTNSLAGLLAVWVLMLAGITWRFAGEHRGRMLAGIAWARVLGMAAALGLMLVCFALTKSRSAYVALAVGLFALPVVVLPASRAVWKWMAAGAAIVLALAVALLVSGAGQTLASEAARSFQFRVEYWQATLDMIANFPLFGVGPGEFQDYYTQYKLPQASEEVRDPHNFILEVWATGGTLALLGLVAVLAGLAMAWNDARRTAAQSDVDSTAGGQSAWLMLCGALVGLPLAYVAGLPFGFQLSIDQGLIAAATGAMVIFSVWTWLRDGRLPSMLPALAALVLMIHWLASGGLTFPGVAGSFWILAALTVNQASQASVAFVPADVHVATSRARWWAGGAIALLLLMIVSCYLTAFYPVLASRAALARAANRQLGAPSRFGLFLQAANADWASSEPFLAIAELSVEQIQNNPDDDPQWSQHLVRSARGVLASHGHSSAEVRRLARCFREAYRVSGNPGAANSWVDMARLASQLYPNSALLQAEYALALDATTKKTAARRVAQRALELDQLTPHADKKLPDDLRLRMQELTTEG